MYDIYAIYKCIHILTYSDCNKVLIYYLTFWLFYLLHLNCSIIILTFHSYRLKTNQTISKNNLLMRCNVTTTLKYSHHSPNLNYNLSTTTTTTIATIETNNNLTQSMQKKKKTKKTSNLKKKTKNKHVKYPH